MTSGDSKRLCAVIRRTAICCERQCAPYLQDRKWLAAHGALPKLLRVADEDVVLTSFG